MLVDSHCHLHDPEFDADRDAVLQRAREAGVSAFVTIGTDLESSRRAVDLADSHENVYAAVGFHPHSAKEMTRADTDALWRLADSPKVVAIGEIGLDFYRNLSAPDVQRGAFLQQLELARALSLPVVIHSRDADEETFETLARYEAKALPDWPKDRPLGIMHCFAGDLMLALRYIQLGFMVSVPGACTYPKADRLCAVAGGIPLRWLAVETDAPYLPPQSQRGRRNEPAYLAETVQRIADLRGEPVQEVCDRTASATAWLFALGDISGEPAAPARGEA
ncbi:MAG TPA: TatD family hydrolase [Dehalococcoidia bacterium]|nr:TatD family hydrolase [Dehalococcoidia bacterium]